MIIVDNIEQGKQEWIAAKSGKPSSSNFSHITTAKGKRSESFSEYLYYLLAQRINGPQEGFKSKFMQRGNDLEPEAREFYEFYTGNTVNQVGVIYKDSRKHILCSPDGLVEGKKKGVEIKCPKDTTQLKYLFANKLPSEYVLQVQGSMYITGYSEWDFLSYYPGMKPLLLTIKRDDDLINKLESHLSFFINELDNKAKQYYEIGV